MTDEEELELLLMERELAQLKGKKRKPLRDITPKYSATDGMSGLDKFAAGVGKSIYDTGRGIGQLTGLVSQEEIDNAKALDASLMDNGAGIAGNIAGQIGMVLAPGGAAMKYGGAIPKIGNAVSKFGKFAAMPTGLIPSALSGGLLGGTQPVASDGSRINNAAIGAASGGLFPALSNAYGFTKTLGTVWTDKFAKKAAGRVLDRMSSNSDTLASTISKNLDYAKGVPGYKPTLAEVVSSNGGSDTGLSTFQRVMEAADPVGDGIKSALKDTVQDQNAAILGGLDNFILDDVARETAEGVRREATEGIYKNLPFVQSNPQLEKILATAAARKAMPRAKDIASNQYRTFGEQFDTMSNLALPDDAIEQGAKQTAKHWTKQPVNYDKDNILTAIRKHGGLNKELTQSTYGNEIWKDMSKGSGLFRNADGQSLDDMSARLVEDGFLPDGSGPYELLEALYNQGNDSMFSSFKSSFDDIYEPVQTANSELVEQMQRIANGLEKKSLPRVKQSVDSVYEKGYWGRDLQSIKQGIKSVVNDQNVSPDMRNSAKGPLSDYSRWLDDNLPDLKVADKKYAELSKPLNESDIFEALASKEAVGLKDTANARLNANQFLTLLGNEDRLLKQAGDLTGVTSLDNALSPTAKSYLSNLENVLRTRASAASDAAAKGSDTAQNLIGHDLVSASLNGLGLPEKWAGGGFAQNIIEKPLSKLLLGVPENKIKRELADAFINPDYGRMLLGDQLKRAQPKEISNILRSMMHLGPVTAGSYLTE